MSVVVLLFMGFVVGFALGLVWGIKAEEDRLAAHWQRLRQEQALHRYYEGNTLADIPEGVPLNFTAEGGFRTQGANDGPVSTAESC